MQQEHTLGRGVDHPISRRAISTPRDGRECCGAPWGQHCAGLPVARQGFAKQKPERGAFGVSETCYRYSPLLSDENEQIADLLVGLTEARKTWGFGLCFLHLRNVKGHPWILLPGNACLHA